MSSALRSPHPACHIDLEFECLVDHEQFAANSDHDHNIFTDGSKIEGKVGAALSVWTGAAETNTLKLALPSYGIPGGTLGDMPGGADGRGPLGRIGRDILRLIIGTAHYSKSESPPSPGRRGAETSAEGFAPGQTYKFDLD
ncbi:unnamed protein product [Euphydryas editha]|uniref:Uncharacterized protein n=1 Tax=Euphydryas editha TaxID=104508 RepID=A0AAU9V2W7_EUPED|nr:unnamed protein product [Euphydryas editha]